MCVCFFFVVFELTLSAFSMLSKLSFGKLVMPSSDVLIDSSSLSISIDSNSYIYQLFVN